MTTQLLPQNLPTDRKVPDLEVAPKTLKFTVAQFQLMGERGVLPEHGRCELIDGEIIEMSPISLKHAVNTARFSKKFETKLGDRSIIWVQNPIDLGNKSLPQPDITVLKYRDDFYAEALPTPADIWLIVEVSDSSLEYDRNVKSRLYGTAGIPQMWLLDVNSETITDFSLPSPLGYKQTCLHTQGDRLLINAFNDVVFAWDELFLGNSR